jgi:alkanesulfonate monooxygenase SsuD/methylene tetrahydromethanopterin reductase-like flavin-dependent oxidoreductase (luciferase family)
MSTPMQFGVQLIFQSFGYPTEKTDGQVVGEEIELALLAEELGFDSLWPVEHHFNVQAWGTPDEDMPALRADRDVAP